MEHVIELDSVNKAFKGFYLKDVSFKIPSGYIMGFIGPNGAGKSTTVKLIMGLLQKDSGTIKVFGQTELTNDIKQHIGFVYDENYFYEEVTGEETGKIFAPFYKNWDKNTFNRYTKDFGLPLKKKVKEFSRGMKTKLTLAIALSHEAELIIMDEPTAGLDPVFRNELLDILKDFIQDGKKTVLFSTHITADLDRIADYVCFLNEGKVVFAGSKEDVLSKYALVKGDKAVLDDKSKRLFVSLRENEFGFEALTSNLPEAKRLLKDAAVFEKASLEDIMVYTVRRGKHA